jgi:hypothetical protein
MGSAKAEMTIPVVMKMQNSFSADDVDMSVEKRREISVGIGDSTQKRTTKNGYQLLVENETTNVVKNFQVVF